MNIKKIFASTLIVVSILVALMAGGGYDLGLASFSDIFIYFVASGLAIYIGAEIHLNEAIKERISEDKKKERESLRKIEKEQLAKEYELVKAEFYAPSSRIKE